MADVQAWRLAVAQGRIYVDVADVVEMFRHYANSGLTGPQRLAHCLREQATTIELHAVERALLLDLDPYEVIRGRQ